MYTSQEYLTRVHEMGFGFYSSQMVETIVVTATDMSRGTIPPFDSQTPLASLTSFGVTIDESVLATEGTMVDESKVYSRVSPVETS